MAIDKVATSAHAAKKLDQLKERKAVLDGLDSEIQDMVRRFEEGLDGLRLGVAISLQIKDAEPDDEVVRYLTFRKFGPSGKWRLVLESWLSDEPDAMSERLLVDAGREERALIFERHIPRLLDKAVEELDQKIIARKWALDEAGAVVEAVAQWSKQRPVRTTWGESDE
jgi:hypothetical protein